MTSFTALPPPVYRPAWPRARFALAGLALGVVGQLVSVVGDVDRIHVTSLEIQGRIVSHADISRSDQLFNLAGGFQLVSMFVAAVLFLVWLHRVIANGSALGGAELRFTLGWAVGWWFVPVVNLVRPVQVLSEAWRTSNVEMLVSTRDARASVKVPIFLRVWCGLWLLFWILTAVVTFMGDDRSARALHATAMVDVALSVTYACAGLVCLVVVSRLRRSQDRRNQARRSIPPMVKGLPVGADTTYVPTAQTATALTATWSTWSITEVVVSQQPGHVMASETVGGVVMAVDEQALPTLDSRPMLLTVKDLEAELQLGRARTYELVRSGVIPTIRIGRAVRIPREALRRWVEAQVPAAAGDAAVTR